MKIVMIGTGNVAVVLTRKLKSAGHQILEVYGRNHIAAALLADKCNAMTCSRWEDINRYAEVYVIAVSDRALAGNEIRLQLKDQLVVHTAGAMPISILKGMSSEYGVLYPYQSIRKEIDLLPEIPFLIDGNTDAAKQRVQDLASTISKKITWAGDQARMQYHLCAVMTNNFSNYLYVLAQRYCDTNGLDFSMLLPLIDETAARLHRFSPSQVQTGPGIRKDVNTIQQHLALLEDSPALQTLYQEMTNRILQYEW